MLFIACVRTLGWQMFQIAKRDLALMLLTGAMAAFNQVCYFASVGYVGVATATLITLCTVPVWVALLASLLLREKFTLAIFFALICAVGGTVLPIDVRSEHITMRSLSINQPILLKSSNSQDLHQAAFVVFSLII